MISGQPYPQPDKICCLYLALTQHHLGCLGWICMSMFWAVLIAQSSRAAPCSSSQGAFQWCLGWDFGRHGPGCFQRKLNQVLWSMCAERKVYFKPRWECESPNKWLGAFVWRTSLTLLWSKGANCIQWRCRGRSTAIFDSWVHSCHTHPHPKLDHSEKRDMDRNPFLSLTLLWFMILRTHKGHLTVVQFRGSKYDIGKQKFLWPAFCSQYKFSVKRAKRSRD